MDALGANARLVAVPNPALMDNHQEELAEEMERRGYLVWGKLGYVNHPRESNPPSFLWLKSYLVPSLFPKKKGMLTKVSPLLLVHNSSLADAVQHVEEHVPKKWPPEAPSDSRYRGGLFDSIISLLPKDE